MARGDANFVISALIQFTDGAVVKTSLFITEELIKSTPVDTGWARANWVPALGSPRTGTTGSPQRVSAAAQATGQASLVAARGQPGKAMRSGVFISNNVPYILSLNDGSSAKAPAGFIQASIVRGANRAERGLKSP